MATPHRGRLRLRVLSTIHSVFYTENRHDLRTSPGLRTKGRPLQTALRRDRIPTECRCLIRDRRFCPPDHCSGSMKPINLGIAEELASASSRSQPPSSLLDGGGRKGRVLFKQRIKQRARHARSRKVSLQCASPQCSGSRSQCVRNSASAIVIAPSQMTSERLRPMLAARRWVSGHVDFRQNAAEDRD
jgi:hypothetical protein